MLNHCTYIWCVIVQERCDAGCADNGAVFDVGSQLVSDTVAAVDEDGSHSHGKLVSQFDMICISWILTVLQSAGFPHL